MRTMGAMPHRALPTGTRARTSREPLTRTLALRQRRPHPQGVIAIFGPRSPAVARRYGLSTRAWYLVPPTSSSRYLDKDRPMLIILAPGTEEMAGCEGVVTWAAETGTPLIRSGDPLPPHVRPFT